MPFQEKSNLFNVLLRFHAACAIDQTAAGAEQGGASGENILLQDNKFLKFLFGEGPTGLGFAPKDSCVGAGDIQQQGVQATSGKDGVTRVSDGEGDIGESAQILPKPP